MRKQYIKPDWEKCFKFYIMSLYLEKRRHPSHILHLPCVMSLCSAKPERTQTSFSHLSIVWDNVTPGLRARFARWLNALRKWINVYISYCSAIEDFIIIVRLCKWRARVKGLLWPCKLYWNDKDLHSNIFYYKYNFFPSTKVVAL